MLAKGAKRREEAIEKAGDAIDSKTKGKFKETDNKRAGRREKSRR